MQPVPTDLSRYDNRWYKPGPLALRLAWYVVQWAFVRSALGWNGSRIFLLRLFGAHIGQSVVIKPHVTVKYPWKLEVGDHSWIGEETWIDNLGQVTIGSHCCLSQGCLLLCGNHDYSRSTFDLLVGEIRIRDGAWIGARAVVCPGVTVGSHAVLSVGSIATKDMDPYSIWQGNPAVKTKDRIINE